ncbi:hypothetical protein B0H17DRAFT_1228138 [Mycena rosella]|uniref:Uncharacterized protein n=1 Tax=Mycena rosella TaxID=1033263 RepID=A0AAD7GRW9_MYCRO|nr:hypothetical protein B0H17DRAFT_1228138 [Mycena rosella]
MEVGGPCSLKWKVAATEPPQFLIQRFQAAVSGGPRSGNSTYSATAEARGKSELDNRTARILDWMARLFDTRRRRRPHSMRVEGWLKAKRAGRARGMFNSPANLGRISKIRGAQIQRSLEHASPMISECRQKEPRNLRGALRKRRAQSMPVCGTELGADPVVQSSELKIVTANSKNSGVTNQGRNPKLKLRFSQGTPEHPTIIRMPIGPPPLLRRPPESSFEFGPG